MRAFGRWLVDVFLWWDFGIGLGSGVATYFLARENEAMRHEAALILATGALVGVALLAVVLTALSILVGFLSEDYLHLLRTTKDGVLGTLRPYKIVGVLSGLSAVFSTVALGLWGVTVAVSQEALLLAIPIGFIVWTIGGTVDLIFRTAKHGYIRSRLPEIREEGVRGLEERRKHLAR